VLEDPLLLHPEEMRRLLDEFAQRSRKIFKALALTDAEMITSHDDICCARGPSFSPTWLREVKRMVTTASYAPGYFMCCGNQVPWNLSPIGIKMYFEACHKYCWR